MQLQTFTSERRPVWDELAVLVQQARGRIDTLPPSTALRLASLYRSAAADLALARRRFPREAVTSHLEGLVGDARNLVYANQSRRDSARSFLGTRYWQRVRERPGCLLASALLLFVPMVAIGLWAHANPAQATRAAQISPLSSNAGRGPEDANRGFSTGKSASLASMIFTNNARVAFLAFAGGLTGGLLTAFSLLYNAGVTGLLVGLTLRVGNADVMWRLLAPHGVLELSLITVAGAAGFRVGWAIVHPGVRRRGEALAAEARAAGELVLGTALWLVVAGLVEGFVTPRGLSLPVALAVGFGLAGVFWALVVWRGRPAASPANLS